MAIDAGDIVYSIGGDTAALDQALDESVNMAESRSADYGAAIGTIGTASIAAGGAITGALGAMALGWAASGDELDKMSERTGVNVTELDRMKFILEQNGAELNTFEMAQRNMIRALDDAADGTGRNAEALERLGLDYHELREMSPEEQFKTIAFAIGDVEDHTERSALAMEMFGSRVGTKLLPMINAGEEAFDALGQRAEELGLHTDESAQQAADFTDTMNELKHAFQGAMITIGPFVAEMLIPFIEKTIDAVVATVEWMQENEALSSAITKLTAVVGAALLAFGLVAKIVMPIVALFKAVAVVAAAFGAVLSGPVVLAIGAVVAAGAALYIFWDEIVGIAQGMWDGLKAAFEAGRDIIIAVWDALVDITTWAIDGILAGFGWLFDGAVGAFESLRDFIVGIWDTIVGVFQGAWDTISGIVGSVIEAITGAISTVTDFLGLTGGAPQIPGYASGGPVKAGEPVMVGERGREMFVPRVDGRILNHNQTAAAMGGGEGVSINISGVTINNDMDIRRVASRLGELYKQRVTGLGMSPAGGRI